MTVRVFFRHMKALQYCARGVRAFYARHGLDYAALLREGTDGAELLATGDAMARRVVEVAEAEAAAQSKEV